MKEKIKTNLDTGFLKLVGIITMTCDHAGKMLFPDIIILEIIGRIALPIFAYCIVVGSLYTKNIWKYLLRLTVFAVIIQIGYTFYCMPYWKDTFLTLNIFFALAIGLLCIAGIEKKKWYLTIAGLLAAFTLNLDYGFSGVLLIFTFYLFRNYPILSFIVVTFQLLFMLDLDILPLSLNIYSYAALSLPLIYMKTKTNFRINKYVFYIFYPIHFFILYLLKIFVIK